MTPDEIKARIEEAGDTLKRLRVTGAWPQEFGSAWPDFPQEEWDAGWERRETIDDRTGSLISILRRVGTKPPRIGLTAEQISRFDEVVEWIEGLGRREEVERLVERFGHSEARANRTVVDRRLVVWGRAAGLSWRKIGERMGRSKDYCRQTYDESVGRIRSRMAQDVVSLPH